MPNAPQTTRDAIIAAAIRLFGRAGFDATSVRTIAAEAGGQNAAMVSYYFGSKAGLRKACAETILARIQAKLPAMTASGSRLDPDAAAARLELLQFALLEFMTQVPEAEDIAAFILRELASPGEVLDILYSGLIEARHKEVCALWGAATGTDPESEATRIAAFAMIGQILYFRIGRPVVERRLGWASIGPEEAARIRQILTTNLHVALAAHRRADHD